MVRALAQWPLQTTDSVPRIGEDRHVMTYTIAAGESFNMVLSHKDTRDPSIWSRMTPSEVLREMTEQFSGWDDK